ncbi:MAG: helix-turn-helix domain-containing protein [Rikenellaceae bacterium]
MKSKKTTSQTTSLRRVSLQRIKRELEQSSYFSDDLVITKLTPDNRDSLTRSMTINGFAAFVITKGSATISIDLTHHDVKACDIAFINPESIVQTISCSDDAEAYFVSASKSFMDSIQIDLSTSLAIFMRFDRDPIMSVSQRDVDEIRQLFQLIKTMIASDKEQHKAEIIRTLFTTMFYILTDLNQRQQRGDIVKKGRGEVIFDEFMLLLHKHNKQERNVQFYADKLDISTKYLSAVVKEISGKTAARWIDESVILEAKALLIYSGLSINEIARELNFATQSFFGKYFKQHTGVSPSRFKQK